MARKNGEDDRRREFLDAACHLIAERGYHSVRVSDIAAACGTSTGTVHYYFPGKRDVLTEALKHAVEQAFARQSAQLRGLSDAREQLLRLVDMQIPRVGPVREEWSVWMQFWAEAMIRPELRPAHADFYGRWRETVAHIVRRGQGQGVFRDVDAGDMALRLTALIDGLAIQVLAGAPGMSAAWMREVLVDVIQRELVAGDARV